MAETHRQVVTIATIKLHVDKVEAAEGMIVNGVDHRMDCLDQIGRGPIRSEQEHDQGGG